MPKKRSGCPGMAQGRRLWAVYDAARSMLATTEQTVGVKTYKRVLGKLRAAVHAVAENEQADHAKAAAAQKRRRARMMRSLDRWAPGNVFGPPIKRRGPRSDRPRRGRRDNKKPVGRLLVGGPNARRRPRVRGGIAAMWARERATQKRRCARNAKGRRDLPRAITRIKRRVASKRRRRVR